MTAFDAALHPRGQAANAGQFRDKVNDGPGGSLATERSAAEVHQDRVQELEDEWFSLWTNTDPIDELDHVGEDPHRQAAVARATTDRRALAQLARNTIGNVGRAVAQNPHTPAGVLHHLATDEDRSRSYEDRFYAVQNPNCDPATIRELWNKPAAAVEWRRAIRIDIASAPNTPSDILRDLVYRSYSPNAGEHPNFPDDALTEAVTNPNRVHLVIGNPKLTDEQLQTAVDSLATTLGGDPDDDDEVWHAVTAAGIARHPNASEATVERLLIYPDAHVQKTARERLTGNRITRFRAAAEQEMRDAGGTEEEITLAGDIAGRRALEGKEWGQE